MKKNSQYFFLLFLFLFSSTISFSQNTYKSILADIESRNAIEIGQLEYILEFPGWWQYYPSCDASKWISVGQNFEPRGDYRARCDLQVHDGKTEVEPTLSEKGEISVPAGGYLCLFWEVKEEEGYELEPNITHSVFPVGGVETRIWGVVGGKYKIKPMPGSNYYMQVKKGDKIVLSITNRMRTDAYRRFFFPCESRLRAFLIPLDGEPFSPDLIQIGIQKPQSGIVYYTDKECN